MISDKTWSLWVRAPSWSRSKNDHLAADRRRDEIQPVAVAIVSTSLLAAATLKISISGFAESPGTAVLPMWWNHSSAYGAESPAFDQFARLDNLISSLPPALENQMSR
ncbi:hypothetical protein [Sinorhizobium fredii]|uniref:hypothetical protein n=1 Tax=Rhizobium fredii TaxID=380 RepID=UPI001FCBB338|nr:hypothetical protein [Sinorhizobium fredii]